MKYKKIISIIPIKWLLPLSFFIISPVFAANSPTTGVIDWAFMIMTLFGGLALFLYGMNKMSDGMKKAAGDSMRKILAAITKNRVFGVIIGAFVTMVIQSSSATTVMLVSFVQAKLMTYVQSIGIILGANIGTTVTAQLIAFKLTDYALAMIAIGFILTLFSKKESYKYLGEALLGFGILFFGMKLMSDAMYPLRTYEPFINMMRGLENPILGLLIGAVFTALIQSSSAFTGIVIVLAQQGLLTIDAGIPMILGANIGTCITAGLASIGTTREAKRVALAHVLFNTIGVLVFIWFAPYLADLVRNISPVGDGSGIAKLAMETPRQIANAHTIFNVGVALLFIPFTPLLAKLVIKILPEREVEKGIQPVTWHIDESVISTPAIAIQLAKTEISRMAKILCRMLDAVVYPFISDEPKQDVVYEQLSLIDGIKMRENKIDYLEYKVTKYLMKISREELNEQQANEVFAMMSVANDMESIGDTITTGILPLLKKKKKVNADFSESGKQELQEYHSKAMKLMNRMKLAFESKNFKKVRKIMKGERKYRELERVLRETHLKRVQKKRADSIATHSIHMELLDMMKHINLYLSEIAKTILKLESEEINKA
jgi:phosphate:Na+ symporter